MSSNNLPPKENAAGAGEHTGGEQVGEAYAQEVIESLPKGVTSMGWRAIGAVRRSGHWEVPERNSDGEIIGWHIRNDDGSKSFVTGGHRGLTLKWPLDSYAGSTAGNPVYVVEGATDTACGIGLGLDIVGRPSATGGATILRTLLRGRHITFIAENDGGAGRDSPRAIGAKLLDQVASVRIIAPPPDFKDLRAWVLGGAAVADITDALATAEPLTEAGSADHAGWMLPRPLFEANAAPQFPLNDAFPPRLAWLRNFIAAVAEAYQVPLDLPAMLALPMISATIAKKFEIELRPGWREVPCLWTLSLAESGERKSVTFSTMSAPIRNWEILMAAELGPEIAQAQEARRIDEARLARLRKKAATGDSDAKKEALDLAKLMADNPVPSAPVLYTSDTTSEALAGMLVENQERALVASCEADALDVMMGRYSEKGSPNMGIWLKGHAGDSERVRRRSRPSEHLERPVLSVALSVQPEAVRGMFASRIARGRGLLARFLTAIPISMVGHRKTGGAAEPVPDSMISKYEHTLSGLLDIEIPAKPLVVRLNAEASELFIQFEAMLEPELARGGFLGDRKDWGGKLCGAIARIALSLHCLQIDLRKPESEDSAHSAGCAQLIEGPTMMAALSWAPYLIDHERLVAGIVGCDMATATADRILAWLERSATKAFSRRDAFNHVRSAAIQHVTDLDPALEMLLDLDYLRRETKPQGPTTSGRPPSEAFLVNPLWQRRDVR